MFTPGDLVTPASPDPVYLFSEQLETATDAEETYYGLRTDLIIFDRGTTGVVLHINPENTARVKVLYNNTPWWANESELRRV